MCVCSLKAVKIYFERVGKVTHPKCCIIVALFWTEMLSKVILPRSVQARSEQMLEVGERKAEKMISLKVPAVLQQTGTPTAHDGLKIVASWLMLLHQMVSPDGEVAQKNIFQSWDESFIPTVPTVLRPQHSRKHSLAVDRHRR